MNKSALITGSSDRIGKQIAICFAEMGFDIALHYFSSRVKAENIRQEILTKNVKCTLFKADFNNTTETISLIKDVCNTFRLKFLVNNASLFVESKLTQKDYRRFETLFNINFKAPYILTKEFARLVNEGMIINMLDTKIAKNDTKHFDYLLTKKFLVNFTKMSALNLAPYIRVNGIAPGLILPPRHKDLKYLEQLSKSIPLKKTGSLDGIRDTIKYLVNNDFITGQIIYLDGGENLLGSIRI